MTPAARKRLSGRLDAVQARVQTRRAEACRQARGSAVARLLFPDQHGDTVRNRSVLLDQALTAGLPLSPEDEDILRQLEEERDKGDDGGFLAGYRGRPISEAVHDIAEFWDAVFS